MNGEFRKIRNAAFHRKYFALLNIAFDNWNPGKINSKYGVPEKNFERFRKDIAILTGYFDLVIRIDGSSRPEAKSISFAKMDNEEFADLYNKSIDVLIKNVYGSNMPPEKMDELVEQYLRFA